MDSAIERVLFTEEQIKNRVAEMGRELSKKYEGKPLIVLGVLRGGAIFCADLVRAMDIPLEISFIQTSSYQAAPPRAATS